MATTTPSPGRARRPAKKTAAKKAAVKKVAVKKVPAKKAALKKAAAKSAPAKKPAVKKAAVKKVPARKAGARVAAKAATKAATSKRPAPQSAAQKSASGSAPAGGAIPRLSIRLYRHGLGDCLLLRFRRADGTGTFNMLIDCGLISVAKEGTATMQVVAQDIKSACGGRLDVVVATHEHWDHASGFTQAESVFKTIDIGEAWYAWTEDPGDKMGKRLNDERARKVAALHAAAQALAPLTRNGLAAERARGVQSLLGFFGIGADEDTLGAAAKTKDIGKTRKAFQYPGTRAKSRYCYPGEAPIQLEGVDQLRVYVLGPPQDEGLIKKSNPTKSGHEVYELASEIQLAENLEAAFLRLAGDAAADAADDCPFDNGLRIPVKALPASGPLADLFRNTWNAGQQQWRQIEHDWTQVAEILALNLDSHTNNTCLVLAFEFTDTGEVFLFPADAQVGNWLSWQDLKWKIREGAETREVSGPDLLARTVFYKVGHHGSHNATLRALGLEQMTSQNLTAFIPVFVEQAKANRWLKMPFLPLRDQLVRHTKGRLLQSDQPPPSATSLPDGKSAAQKKFLASLVTEKLYFELNIG